MPAASPFESAHQARGAVMRPVEGALYPIRFGHPFEEHRAARTHAGILDVSFLGKLEVSGPDAREYMQRIVSADLSATGPGHGRATYLLSGQGKVMHAFTALATPDGFLLLTEAGDTAPLAKDLAIFQFGEKLAFHDYTAHLGALLIVGPAAGATVSAAAGGAALPTAAGDHAFAPIEGAGVLVARDDRAGAGGFLLLVPRPACDAVLARLETAGAARGVKRVGLAAYDSLRIEAGKLRFGLDYSNDLFPQEIAMDDAFSLVKGCYPGQETVARIDTYGKTHRRLCGLILDSPAEDVPKSGDRLLRGEEEVGEVRSWAISPALERPIAIALVRTSKAPTGAELAIRADDGRVLSAKVVDLPIVP